MPRRLPGSDLDRTRILDRAKMVDLVQAGFATATAERMMAGKKPMEVTRVRITAAGRRALAD